MKFLMSLFVCLVSTISLFAANISGIRVDAGRNEVVVTLNGQDMCDPVSSCFIANLSRGTYNIEVSIVREVNHRYTKRVVYERRINYTGYGILVINVERECNNGSNIRPERPGYDNDHSYNRRVMSDDQFNRYLRDFDRAFKTEQKKMIDASVSSGILFTTAQVRKLVRTLNFDSEKLDILLKLRRNIYDVKNIVTLKDELTFSSNKQKFLNSL